jgi:hypothetical protein
MARDRGGGLLAFLFDELRGALQDIRQKVVEEGWFGRVVTPRPVVGARDFYRTTAVPLTADQGDPLRRVARFEEAWRPIPRDGSQSDLAPVHGEIAPDRGGEPLGRYDRFQAQWAAREQSPASPEPPGHGLDR